MMEKMSSTFFCPQIFSNDIIIFLVEYMCKFGCLHIVDLGSGLEISISNR